MKKVLMIASVPSMIGLFNMSNIELLEDLGYEVQIACNFQDLSVWNVEKIEHFIKILIEKNRTYFQIDFTRSVMGLREHRKAYLQTLKLLQNNNYDFVHCHTPIASAITRVAANKVGTKVIYTAHGFHFFQGAPLINWVLFYPLEKYLSKITDTIITINKEDYRRADTMFKSKVTKYIPGVGIDIKKYSKVDIDINEKRKELKIPTDAILLISAGELNIRKNHETPIRAIAELQDKKIYYIICGEGELHKYLIDLCIKLGVEKQVKFLGYRNDMNELCSISDIYIFPSQREGLGIAALEGMACGLPLITSDINGIKDYAEDNLTGYCLSPYDINGFSKSISTMAKSDELRKKIGDYNVEVAKKFDLSIVNKLMYDIYQNISK